jgi:hypothetical protein
MSATEPSSGMNEYCGNTKARSGSDALPGFQNKDVGSPVDANAVFVQYDLAVSSSKVATRQLALVEMRGEQIARMRNFGPIPAATVASTTLLAAATPCAARASE